MDELRLFLNSLDRSEQHNFAAACGTTVNYLRKAISVNHKLDGALARKIDMESYGRVPKQSLRPDIWPELVQKDLPNESP